MIAWRTDNENREYEQISTKVDEVCLFIAHLLGDLFPYLFPSLGRSLEMGLNIFGTED